MPIIKNRLKQDLSREGDMVEEAKILAENYLRERYRMKVWGFYNPQHISTDTIEMYFAGDTVGSLGSNVGVRVSGQVIVNVATKAVTVRDGIAEQDQYHPEWYR